MAFSFSKLVLTYGTARKFAPAPIDGGEGTACPEVNADGFKTPEGEIPIREEDRATDDDFERQLREAEEEMKKLDEKLMRVDTLPILTRVRDALAKEFHIKAGDVSARWKALHNEAPTDDEEKPLAAFQVDVMPSEKPEGLKEVFFELVKVFKRFIVFKAPDDQAAACALWVLGTWFVDRVDFAPYLLITAPEKRCGKSQLLGLVARLSRRPLEAGSMSAPVLFRAVEKYHPTIFIDEVDSFLERDEDLKGMIKCGIERGKALAWRCEKDPTTQKQDIVSYDSFGFKALSGIGAQNISDTITDRCVTIELKRKLTKEKLPKVREEPSETWSALTAKCARVALDYGERLRNYRPVMPSALNDRDADKWAPLIALSDLMDEDEGMAGALGQMGKLGNYCRAVAVRLSSDLDADEPRAVELLRNIREVLANQNGTPEEQLDYILSYLLVQELNNNDEWCWSDYRNSKGISPKTLAKMLKPFKVHAQTNLGPMRKNGYMKADFSDPFQRYLTDGVDALTKEEQ